MPEERGELVLRDVEGFLASAGEVEQSFWWDPVQFHAAEAAGVDKAKFLA